jgi:hypothetical protein
LVTITSEQEQAFVSTLSGGSSRWIGLSRFGATSFSWVTGERLGFTNWEPSEPAFKGSVGESAAALRGDSQQWFEDTLSSQHPALCEWP